MTKERCTYDAKVVLRGALFGCGQVTKYHMRAWAMIPNVTIAAVANRTIEKAYETARLYGIGDEHVYQSYLDLLRNETIDFVDIATAPEIHFDQVMAAASYGCHILCQKPFAPSLELARAMIRAANEAGVLLSIHENWRWRSWYRETKAILEAGTIGTPIYCYIKRHSDVALPRNDGVPPALLVKQPYTGDMKRLLIYEWGIHLIDVARFLFGEAERVYAVTSKTSACFQGEDRAIVHLEMNSMHTIIDISWGTVEEEVHQSQLEHMVIEGDAGTIKLLPEEGNVLKIITKDRTYAKNAMALSPDEEYQRSYTKAQEHFIFCLRRGINPETCGYDNLKTLTCMFAAYESAEAHKIIEINE